ncbi:hypothetical protein [Shinella sp. G-2]|uniref:hypothetical protein n=1 Tax=Shinella sp. G-2 TaxID=3133141 RepID=UPI003D06C086
MAADTIVRLENRDLVALRQQPGRRKTSDAGADNRDFEWPIRLRKMAHDDPFAASNS